MKSKYSEPADIKVYVRGKGVVVNEKGLLALNKESKQIVAVGNEVLQVEAEHGEEYEIISAFHQGRIADFTCAEKILKFFVYKAANKRKSFRKPDIMICVPPDVNEVEKKAYEDAVFLCGARNVYLCLEPFDYIIQHVEEQSAFKHVKYIIGITKEEPVAYIKEALSEVIEIAKKEGLDKDWIREFFGCVKL